MGGREVTSTLCYVSTEPLAAHRWLAGIRDRDRHSWRENSLGQQTGAGQQVSPFVPDSSTRQAAATLPFRPGDAAAIGRVNIATINRRVVLLANSQRDDAVAAGRAEHNKRCRPCTKPCAFQLGDGVFKVLVQAVFLMHEQNDRRGRVGLAGIVRRGEDDVVRGVSVDSGTVVSAFSFSAARRQTDQRETQAAEDAPFRFASGFVSSAVHAGPMSARPHS